MRERDNKKARVRVVHKEQGETPLEAIEKLRENDPSLKKSTITYAGRLDPMAEGVLLLLLDEEVEKKDDYTKLDKEYEFKVLFGFATDTYDLLGRVEDSALGRVAMPNIESALTRFLGAQEQAYPPYSSKTVDGKPLFMWAREGRLYEIDIPVHDIEIKELETLQSGSISRHDLLRHINDKVGRVRGDFRQEKVLELWDAYIKNAKENDYPLITLRAVVSSGTYIRQLVQDIGKALRIPATTFSIIRTKVGTYDKGDVEA